MGRAISNKNVLAAQFETADFDGPFLASFAVQNCAALG